jgi:transcriptional regulator with XRE-family HTH domain
MMLDMAKGRPPIHPQTDFGKRLAQAREQAGLTQTQLGDKLGLSQRAIAHWERDETALLPDQLDAVAKALKVSVDALVSGNGHPPKESAPRGKVRQVFEAVTRLPRRQQEKIVEVVDALVRAKS